MKFSLSLPATASILLCHAGFAGSSSASTSELNTNSSCSSDGLVNSSNYTSESETSSGLTAEEEPQAPLGPTAEELEDAKQRILAMVGGKDLRLDYFSVRKRIKDLHERFFSMLRIMLMGCSRTCPPSFLNKRLRNKILATSPEDFRRCFDRMYRSSKNIPRMQTYRKKIEEHVKREQALASQIENKTAGALESDDGLRALENSLSRHRRKLLSYSNRLKSLSMLHRSCEEIHHNMMNEFLLHKILGTDTVLILHESYLVGKKGLKERGHAEAAGGRKEPGEGKTPSDPCEEQPGKCTICPICRELLKPSEYIIECEKHRFHGSCLYKWSEEKPTCPVCIREFTPDQKKGLETGKKMQALKEIRSVSELRDDPIFEERYMRDGRPIERGEKEESLLRTVCKRIRYKTLDLGDSPHFSEVFDNQEEYPELHIPRSIMDYFGSTRVGHHDPRSRGFARLRAAMMGRMKLYMNRSTEIRDPMRKNADDILFYSLLDVFCAADCLVEHLYTRLYEINTYAGKRSEIRSNAAAYRAISSTMRQGRHFYSRALRAPTASSTT